MMDDIDASDNCPRLPANHSGLRVTAAAGLMPSILLFRLSSCLEGVSRLLVFARTIVL